MTPQSVSEGQTLCQSGDPLNNLQLIVNGTVKLFFPGGEILLEKGDFIGLLELDEATHFFTYKAESDTTLIPYPYSRSASIEPLLSSSEDLANLLAISMFKQVCFLLDHYEMDKYACSNLYQSLLDSYNVYKDLCTRYEISPKALPDLENAAPLVLEDDIEEWVSGYYTTIRKTISGSVPDFLTKNPPILSGMMIKACRDVKNTLSVCRILADYQSDTAVLLLNENHLDFFDLYTSLLFRLGSKSQDSTAISAAISTLLIQLETENSVDGDLLKKRVTEYKERLQVL